MFFQASFLAQSAALAAPKLRKSAAEFADDDGPNAGSSVSRSPWCKPADTTIVVAGLGRVCDFCVGRSDLVAAVPPVRSNECRDASLTDAPRDRGRRLCPRRYAGREQNRAYRSSKLGPSLRGAIPLPPRVASRRDWLDDYVAGRFDTMCERYRLRPEGPVLSSPPAAGNSEGD